MSALTPRVCRSRRLISTERDGYFGAVWTLACHVGVSLSWPLAQRSLTAANLSKGLIDRQAIVSGFPFVDRRFNRGEVGISILGFGHFVATPRYIKPCVAGVCSMENVSQSTLENGCVASRLATSSVRVQPSANNR